MFRKNTASQVIHFQGIDATTGGIKSGVSWTVRRCIDGTFAAATGTVTEDSTNGWYKFAMSQADTNGNNIAFNFTGTGAVPQTVNIVTTACDPTTATNFGITALPATAVTTNASLITSGTGTDQLSVASGKILLQATQSGVTIPTVTTVTNQLTAAQIATGVWQDTTAGDFTVASSIGKCLYIANIAPGSANGLATVGASLTIGTNNDKTGYSLSVTPPTSAAIATAVWTDTTAGDFTTALSIGKSIMNGVSLGTGLTINDLTTKTGYSLTQSFPANFSSLSIDGSGLIKLAPSQGAVTFTGTSASGGTPATAGLTLVGGAASTTSGGTAAPGFSITGGAGAASTNGAADGATFTGGGTTTVSGGSGVTFAKTGSKNDFNATSTPLTLAKTTNITGFNDIAATSIVSSGAITTSGGAVVTVTNLTNAPSDSSGTTTLLTRLSSTRATNLDNLDATVSSRLASASYTAPTNLTAAQIATGVWTDTTAGDFTTALSIGKSIMNGVSLGTGLTINDLTTKTGFSLTQTFPTNFSSLSIDGSGRIDLIKIAGTTQTAKDIGAINVTNLNTLSGHDPGATLGTSTLTQTQVTGGAYALNSSSFAFNAALDFTTTQKAATIARVTLTDTLTTYTGNTPQTGDSYAIVNSGTFGNSALNTALTRAIYVGLNGGG